MNRSDLMDPFPAIAHELCYMTSGLFEALENIGIWTLQNLAFYFTVRLQGLI